MTWSRRHFLRSASGLLWVAPPALVLGCGRSTASSARPHDAASVSAGPPQPPASAAGAWSAGAGVTPAAPAASASPAAGACRATDANIEGPYWREGAPFRDDLVDPGVPGVPLQIEGRVLAAGCSAPVRGAVLDFWQADGDGRYDNDGSLKLAPGKLRLRGKVRGGDDGQFRVRTVVPGHYLNGKRYRPAHVHVRIEAPGFAPLTTQLYFPDDPYNEGDPFLLRSLIMRVAPDGQGRRASFEFVLARA